MMPDDNPFTSKQRKMQRIFDKNGAKSILG
jgi:hypothetical protein